MRQLAKVAAFVVVLAWSNPAAAQCTTAADIWDSSVAGYPAVSGQTTASGSSCQAIEANVKVSTWINQVSLPACAAGTRVNNVCFSEVYYPGAAFSKAIKFQSCGVFTGNALHAHMSINTPLNTVAGSPYSVILYATCDSGYITAQMACVNQGQYEFDEYTFACTYVSPIVVALGRDRSYRMTGLDGGVRFDLNADGYAERTAWTRPGSGVAFLAIDRTGNGLIDDGAELFGNYTVPGAANGFVALKALSDQRHPGVAVGDVSAGNPLYEQLLLWEDANHNGVSDAGELSKFSEQFTSAGLWYEQIGRRDAEGNKLLFKGGLTRRTAPGLNRVLSSDDDLARTLHIYDVFLKTAR